MEDLHSQRQTISRSRQRVRGSSYHRNVLPGFFFFFYKECIESFVLLKKIWLKMAVLVKLCSCRWKKWIQTLVKVPECCLAWWRGKWWLIDRVYWCQLSDIEHDRLADKMYEVFHNEISPLQMKGIKFPLILCVACYTTRDGSFYFY